MRAHANEESEPDAITIHEDRDGNAPQDQDIQQEEAASRPALKDITGGNSATVDEVAELKKSIRGKWHKVNKKKGKQANVKDEQNTSTAEEVADQASAGNATCEQQPDEQVQEATALETPAVAEATSAPELAPGPTTEVDTMMSQPPERNIAITSKTPKFDPEVHVPVPEPSLPKHGQEDSFIDSIKPRSPTKLSREASHDSFVKSIKSRSPARVASRIEDSVEAMDALEDAIEQISTKLPQIEHLEVESPLKPRKQSPSNALHPSARKTALDTKVTAKTPKPVRPSPANPKAAHLKPAPPRTGSGRVTTVKPTKPPTIGKSTSRPSTVMPKAATAVEPTKPTMSFSSSPAKTQPNVVKKRVTTGPLSTSKPAFVPAKSAKAPTVSTFALPGEAVAAKLKAQREERAKKENEEGKKTFKARPAPSMTGRPSMAPRENKASLARKSSAPTAKVEGENKENLAPKPQSRPSAVAGSKLTGSSLDVKKSRTDSTTSPHKPNSSVRRTTSSTPLSNNPTKKPSPVARPSIAPKPAPHVSVVPRVASLTKSVKPPPRSSDAIMTSQQKVPAKVNGKEVYGRSKLEKERMEKEKREKEEAAKKARAEAAERGRQASREWAEKQRRKVEERKATAAVAVAANNGGGGGGGEAPATAVEAL